MPSSSPEPVLQTSSSSGVEDINLDDLIEAELIRLDQGGGLPVWRKRVNRALVLESLGINRLSYAYKTAGKQHFERFNALLEARGTLSKLEAFPDKLERFLYEQGASNTVQFINGRVNRSWALGEIGEHYSSVVRSKRAQDVFANFDRRYASLAPASQSYPDLAQVLAQRLARGNLPVFKDRLNVKEIARQLDVPESAFALVPDCGPLLRDANEEVRRRNPCRPYSHEHRRNFSFAGLIEFYGKIRATWIADRFLAVAESVSAGRADSLYLAVLDVLVQIASSGKFKDIVQCITEGVEPEQGRAKECLRWYRDHLHEAPLAPSTLGRRITNARNILERLRLLENALEALRPRGRRRRAHVPKRSFAEARNAGIDGVVAHVASYAKTHKVEFEDREIRDFLGNLAVAQDLGSLEPSELPAAIEKLNRRRLHGLFQKASAVFSAEVEIFLQGQEDLKAGAAQDEAIRDLVFRYDNGDIAWADFCRFFADRASDGLAAYLHYVENWHGGRVPRGTVNLPHVERGRRATLLKALGGAEFLQSKLNLSAEAITAACLMYLIEAGANGAVGRTLTVGCVQPSTISGHKEVSGWKSKGGGKPIYNDLRSLSSDGRPTAVEAVELVQFHQPLLARHNPAEAHSLFLIDIRGLVRPVQEHTLLAYLRDLVSGETEFDGLTVRVDMIRSSVLLDAALSGDGNIRVAAAIANHSSNVTSHYTEKLPLRLLYDAKIRKFQKLFQGAIVYGIDGACERLGIAREEAEALASEALSTGLGRLCMKPMAGIQPGTKEGEPCTRLGACHSCEAIYLVLDPEVIADLIIWRRSLSEASVTWAAERPERFEQEWADDLAWCEAATEALQRGPAARVYVHAEKIAKARSDAPGFTAPQPW